LLEEAIFRKKVVGRPQLQYLKQVTRNTVAEKNGLQQLQMESCQPIKRVKDKNMKNPYYFITVP